MPRKATKEEAAAVWTPIGDLQPWGDNPRPEDNSESVGRVADSIRRFGFAAPIVARKADGMIIAGHTRFEAAVDVLGLEKVPVRFMDLDPADARLLALADNRLQELGVYDDDALARVLSEMEEEGLDLDAAGYSDEDLNSILGRVQSADVEDPGPVGLPEMADSKPGEVYLLGPHRLVCGDSTEEGAIATALDGKLADLIWTDPPYGVAVNDVASVEEARRLHRRTDGKTVANDSLSEADLDALLSDVLEAALASCKPGAAIYVAAPAGPRSSVFVGVLYSLGIWRATLVWVKDRLVLSRGDYHYRHEPIFYGWKPGAAHHAVEDRSSCSVFEVKRPGASPDHPTIKPVELIEPMLLNSSDRDALVLDPFGGSGSTLIAAARTGRPRRA